AIVMRFLARHGIAPARARGVLAWFLPLALTGVFVGIFAWANPIISEWFSHLGIWLNRFIQWLPNLINPVRMLFWLAFAIFAWMLLRARTHRRRSKPLGVESASADRLLNSSSYELPPGIPAAFVIRCLLL